MLRLAVRQVAETGKNVLNLQSAYFKALDSHFLGLQELVKSSADVCEESDKFASELASITTTLQRINREEEKLVNICTNYTHASTNNLVSKPG